MSSDGAPPSAEKRREPTVIIGEQSSGVFGANVVTIVALVILLLYWIFALATLIDTRRLLADCVVVTATH